MISYPSEWSFGLLKAAALLTLDAKLVGDGARLHPQGRIGIQCGLCRHQATHPRCRSSNPLARRVSGRAYGQFCDHFLSPLLLEAYAGIAFQGSLRGATEGYRHHRPQQDAPWSGRAPSRRADSRQDAERARATRRPHEHRITIRRRRHRAPQGCSRCVDPQDAQACRPTRESRRQYLGGLRVCPSL